MRDLAFTFDWYDSLLTTLLDHEYSFGSFEDGVTDGTVYLRHDVDFSPEKARRMARLEAEKGVTSTYFFLLRSELYNVFSAEMTAIIDEISELGHEVALHFDANQYWETKPDPEELTSHVATEQSVFETVADDPASVVAFHNPTEWVFNETFDGFTHTYESRFFDDIGYVADSNQRWREQRPFESDLPETLQILAHPSLWGDADKDKNDLLRDVREGVYSRIDESIAAGMIDDPPQPTE